MAHTHVYGECQVTFHPSELRSCAVDGHVSEVARIDNPSVIRGPFAGINAGIQAAKAWDAEVVKAKLDSVSSQSDANTSGQK